MNAFARTSVDVSEHSRAAHATRLQETQDSATDRNSNTARLLLVASMNVLPIAPPPDVGTPTTLVPKAHEALQARCDACTMFFSPCSTSGVRRSRLLRAQSRNPSGTFPGMSQLMARYDGDAVFARAEQLIRAVRQDPAVAGDDVSSEARDARMESVSHDQTGRVIWNDGANRTFENRMRPFCAGGGVVQSALGGSGQQCASVNKSSNGAPSIGDVLRCGASSVADNFQPAVAADTRIFSPEFEGGKWAERDGKAG